MDKKTNRQKYSTFSEYILNDPFVLRFLYKTARRFGFFVIAFFINVFVLLKWWILVAVFIFILIVSLYRYIKMSRLGVIDNFQGTAAEIIWSKDKIKVVKRK